MTRPSPYVGLVPYSESDADLFFGRERERRIIGANLRASRLTLLYGASGVGKSSLLQAGLLPGLHAAVARGRDAAARNGRRSTAVADRPPLAVAMFQEWRDPPVPPLAEAIRAAVIEACGDDDVAPWEPTTPLGEALRGYTARIRTLLVILDQFEEYFLYHPEDRSPGSFDLEFAAVANDVDLRVHFLLSLREDALSQLDRFKGRIPGVFANYLRIDYLDRDAGRRAIKEPIAAYNRALPAGAPEATIDDDLVEAVLDDVRTGRLAFGDGHGAAETDGGAALDGAGDRVETPYLQLVMERLWESAGGHALTLAALRDLGGAEAIVSSHLSEAMASLSASDRDLAATVFQFLVTPSKTKIAHRASDLAFWAKQPSSDVAGVLDQLAGERRIVRSLPPPPGEDEGRYEIFHDVLAEAVLEWRAGHEAARERRELAERLREEDRARRKARRDRILRRLAVGLGIALVVLAVVLVLALAARSRSQAEEREARSAGLAAAAAGQITVDPELAVLLARRAFRVDDTQAAREALIGAVAASHVRARLGRNRVSACPRACRPEKAAPGWRAPPAALAATPSVPFGGDQPAHVSYARGGHAVVAVNGGQVRIWRPEEGVAPAAPGIADADSARITPDGLSVLVLQFSGAQLLSRDGGTAWKLPGRPVAAAVSADGHFVASADASGKVSVRRPGAEPRLRTVSPPSGVTQVEFSPRDPGLLVVARRSRVDLWRWRSSAPRRVVGGGATPAAAAAVPAPAVPAAHAGPIAAPRRFAAHFSADGRSILIHDALNGRVRVAGVNPVAAHPWAGRGIARALIAPQGGRVLALEGRTATLRSASTGQVLATLAGHAAEITSAAFGPGGRLVATGSADGTARLWDAAGGAELLELRGHGAAVTDVAFSPDGRMLATDGDDGTERLWDIGAGTMLDVGRPVVAAPAREGRVLVYDVASGRLVRWTPETGETERLGGYGARIQAARFSPGGGQVALSGNAAGRGLLVRTLGVRSSEKVLARHPATLMAFSPDGDRLFTVNDVVGPPSSVARAQAHLWDTTTGKEIALQQSDLGPDVYTGVTFGPGDLVLLSAAGAPARIIDARSGRTLTLFRRHLSVSGGARASQRGGFSPDGRFVVTAGSRRGIVWDPTTGAVVHYLPGGHTAPLTDAAFSPDGRWIATGSRDGTIRIWDARSGHGLASLPSHASPADSVAFTPDGGEILSTSEEGVVRLNRCIPCSPFTDVLKRARESVTRPLTNGERNAYPKG